MCHRRRMLNYRFDAPKGCGDLAEFQTVDQDFGGVVRADVKTDHPAKAPHLTPCDLVIWVRFEAGIINSPNLRIAFEHIRQGGCVVIMSLHSEAKCFYPTHHKPRDLWSDVATE